MSEDQNTEDRERQETNPDPNHLPKDVPLPPPSLKMLVTTLASQAMVSMGIFPNPATGKSEFYLHQATHLIDTIQLIYDKTAGNRSEEETDTIEKVLNELQMLYVAAANEKKRRDEAA
ncbi:MAG: DUF1844 domain-containing protein [Thermoguttaceae bacterium]|nr:DUF1844 domain-containing protein [Thermoguttaceae bacterium]